MTLPAAEGADGVQSECLLPQYYFHFHSAGTDTEQLVDVPDGNGQPADREYERSVRGLWLLVGHRGPRFPGQQADVVQCRRAVVQCR